MPDKAPDLSSTAQVNALFWITSLKESEKGTTKRILEDLEYLFNDIKILYEVHEPKSARELFYLLENIEQIAINSGIKPILHFDTHGGKHSGLYIVESDEAVSWESLLAALRRINVNTGNNLCVISLACFGFHLADSLSILDEAPFYLLAAPEDIITADFIEDNIVHFYTKVFRELDISQAFSDILSNKLLLLHCEELLFIGMKRYVRDSCTGKGAKNRVEERISYARSHGLVNSDNIKLMRKIAKDTIRPSQYLLDKYVSSFLLGKKPPYNMNDILKQIKFERRKK